jgi:uncharacterized Zn finger protein (UPF0148 family)
MKKKKTFEIQCASASGHSATESVMPCPNCGEDVDTSEAEGHGTGTVVCPHCEKKFHPATLTIESKSADVPIARACLEAMKARGMNPTLDQIVETVRLEHGVILDRREVAMQIEGRRQGYSSTSARAHLASCAAAEASANVRNAAAGCNLNELRRLKPMKPPPKPTWMPAFFMARPENGTRKKLRTQPWKYPSRRTKKPQRKTAIKIHNPQLTTKGQNE